MLYSMPVKSGEWVWNHFPIQLYTDYRLKISKENTDFIMDGEMEDKLPSLRSVKSAKSFFFHCVWLYELYTKGFHWKACRYLHHYVSTPFAHFSKGFPTLNEHGELNATEFLDTTLLKAHNFMVFKFPHRFCFPFGSHRFLLRSAYEQTYRAWSII